MPQVPRHWTRRACSTSSSRPTGAHTKGSMAGVRAPSEGHGYRSCRRSEPGSPSGVHRAVRVAWLWHQAHGNVLMIHSRSRGSRDLQLFWDAGASKTSRAPGVPSQTSGDLALRPIRAPRRVLRVEYSASSTRRRPAAWTCLAFTTARRAVARLSVFPLKALSLVGAGRCPPLPVHKHRFRVSTPSHKRSSLR